jgi:hypothetical protein
MKRLAFAVGVLALGLAASSAARADYAVVRYQAGYCQIWWDASADPWGSGWTKIAMVPDYASARAALNVAIANNQCD